MTSAEVLTQKEIHGVILQQFSEFQASFRENELATIAVTSKPEAFIRDKFAFKLSQALVSSGIVVAREWSGQKGQHADLALFDNSGIKKNRATAILEFKSMYTFDPLKAESKRPNRGRYEYRFSVKNELTRWGSHCPLVYVFLVATNIRSEVTIYKPIVKYWAYVNNELKKDPTSPKTVEERCIEEVENWFPSPQFCTERNTLEGGHYLGTKLDVICWLVWKVQPE